MHLRTLTLRGFKSFASSTTLQLEPGITCVVGPNGSGKSNVVDALAWVMGEQGAKTLRGGKMEDVIFAGTSARPPLGRAEVVLTIDNTDGALPIDYAEVSISRTMFRNGGSEYAINGQVCRLLDVQELLSDSGIGREMHVIVGQGQLDAILHASPQERRGFIEEAAGVLKYRRRKEKAIRKLDATDGNLTRLNDLLVEIRRQLKPLGRQAEVARRASVVQSEARDARARLLADDAVSLRESMQRELGDEQALASRRAAVEASLVVARSEETQHEQGLSRDAPSLSSAQEMWFALAGLRERISGTTRLASERCRNSMEEVSDVWSGRDPDQIEVEADRLLDEEAGASRAVHERTLGLQQVVRERELAEAASIEEDRRVAELFRAAGDRREGVAQLSGQVDSVRSRAAAAQDEIDRLEAARDAALGRARRAQLDFTSLETSIAGLDVGEQGLDAEHEGASSLLADIESRLAKLQHQSQVADRERAALSARKGALELGLARKDGAGALLEAGEVVSGLMGSVAALLSVRPGFETAVAAALGNAADAVAVEGPLDAVGAIHHLKDADLVRAEFVVGGAADEGAAWPVLGPGEIYAPDVVEAPLSLRPALGRLLDKTAVVDDVDSARCLVQRHPDVVAVSRDGDVVGVHFAAGGSGTAPSLLEVQAAVDEVTIALTQATAGCERLRFELTALETERSQAQGRVNVALAQLHESDATLAAVAEELGHLGSLVRAAKSEAQRLTLAIASAREARDGDMSGAADLEERLVVARSSPDSEPDTIRRDELIESARRARQAETDARLALRTVEERAQALHGRAEELRRAAADERAAQVRFVARQDRRRREGQTAQAVGAGARMLLARVEVAVAEALQRRTAVEAAKAARELSLTQARHMVRDLEVELSALTDTVHRDQMLRTEQRLRVEQLEQHALEALGLDLESLVADYGPHHLVPSIGAAPLIPSDEEDATDDGGGVVYVREEQERRLRSAERALAQLGRINPLALEEFSALEERHKFLTEQLEDLRKTRRDLLDIVKEVDERVEQVFTAAFADVASAFGHTFARLFPGGEGRLVLTAPDDLLETGIDVEARPAGKKVKRLSLLSGGERSLVAVAFLVALFKARPSPFYILDEVEAALDDTNLGRLLTIYEELRETSQLVVITHQKRTMEVADALYGVTMRGDGVSAVISQRLRETQTA
ncbi:MAG: chromosome segregation protein SMC [Nocardioidaceae bacterium]